MKKYMIEKHINVTSKKIDWKFSEASYCESMYANFGDTGMLSRKKQLMNEAKELIKYKRELQKKLYER